MEVVLTKSVRNDGREDTLTLQNSENLESSRKASIPLSNASGSIHFASNNFDILILLLGDCFKDDQCKGQKLLNKFDDLLSLKNLRKDLKAIRVTLVYKATIFSPDHIIDKETAISVVKKLIEHISIGHRIYNVNAIFLSKAIAFPDIFEFRNS